MQTIDLERMTFAAQQTIGAELAHDFTLPSRVEVQEQRYRGLAISVRQEVYSQHLERAMVRYPETWRDAVKDRLYAWLRAGHWPWGADLAEKRWPVRWYQATIDVKALYPKVGLPHERHILKVLRQDELTTTPSPWAPIPPPPPTSRRTWIGLSRGQKLLDALYRIRSDAYTGQSWHAGRRAYSLLLKEYDIHSYGFLVNPSFTLNEEPPMLGCSLKVDPLLPDDVIEFRDDKDQVVGKIWNVGSV